MLGAWEFVFVAVLLAFGRSLGNFRCGRCGNGGLGGQSITSLLLSGETWAAQALGQCWGSNGPSCRHANV